MVHHIYTHLYSEKKKKQKHWKRVAYSFASNDACAYGKYEVFSARLEIFKSNLVPSIILSRQSWETKWKNLVGERRMDITIYQFYVFLYYFNVWNECIYGKGQLYFIATRNYVYSYDTIDTINFITRLIRFAFGWVEIVLNETQN